MTLREPFYGEINRIFTIKMKGLGESTSFRATPRLAAIALFDGPLMSNNVPWSINAVEPQTWDTAREAARRSGLSVGEWLEAAIRGNAGERGFSRRGNRHTEGRFQDQLDDISDRLDRSRSATSRAAAAARGRKASSSIRSMASPTASTR